MATAEHREPCDSRGSCTVLGAPGGEIPPGDSTNREGSASPLHRRLTSNNRSAYGQADTSGQYYNPTLTSLAATAVVDPDLPPRDRNRMAGFAPHPRFAIPAGIGSIGTGCLPPAFHKNPI